MTNDITGKEFLGIIATMLKWIIAVIALRVLFLFLGFTERVPVIDPLLNWLKGVFSGFSIGSSPL